MLKIMKKTFLEYSKIILEKVSFNSEIFQKEYLKAKNYLSQKEAELLDAWLLNTGKLQLIKQRK